MDVEAIVEVESEVAGEATVMAELDTDFREDFEGNVEATVEVEDKVGEAARGLVGGGTKSEVYHSPRLSINRGRREAVPPTARH